MLTGGEAHDCPIAERLIRRVKPAKRMLGDKAYDSAELREDMDERGTKPVIPNRSNRKQPFSFNKTLYTSIPQVGEKWLAVVVASDSRWGHDSRWLS